MVTQKDIDALVSYSKMILGGRVDLYPEDIVQDVIISFLDKPDGYSFQELKKAVWSASTTVKHTDRTGRGFASWDCNETTRFCKKCNDSIPIALFYIFTYKKVNKSIISEYCKKHHIQRIAELRRKKHQPKPKTTKLEKIIRKRYMNKLLYERRKLTPGFMKAQALRAVQRYHKRTQPV